MLRGPLALLLAALLAAPAAAEIRSARFVEETTRYPHGVLGDDIEYGALRLTLTSGARRLIRLPETRVFEDLAPRLVDVDGDGAPEVIVVESDAAQGARLSIYGEDGLIAATPFIGRSFRWLAPLGAADLDGDGRVEIAYVDRPHLAKTLRVWRFDNGRLSEIARMDDLTNHRIGDALIWGGIRTCAQGPEMVLADGAFERIVLVRFSKQGLVRTDTDQPPGETGFARVLACKG